MRAQSLQVGNVRAASETSDLVPVPVAMSQRKITWRRYAAGDMHAMHPARREVMLCERSTPRSQFMCENGRRRRWCENRRGLESDAVRGNLARFGRALIIFSSLAFAHFLATEGTPYIWQLLLGLHTFSGYYGAPYIWQLLRGLPTFGSY